MSSLSRQEIETACVLYALGSEGCTGEELASRLGLGPSLTTVVVGVVESFVAEGWITRADDRFVITIAGREWLRRRVAGTDQPASGDGL